MVKYPKSATWLNLDPNYTYGHQTTKLHITSKRAIKKKQQSRHRGSIQWSICMGTWGQRVVLTVRKCCCRSLPVQYWERCAARTAVTNRHDRQEEDQWRHQKARTRSRVRWLETESWASYDGKAYLGQRQGMDRLKKENKMFGTAFGCGLNALSSSSECTVTF